MTRGARLLRGESTVAGIVLVRALARCRANVAEMGERGSAPKLLVIVYPVRCG